jgi:hypothetical protein
MYTKFKYNTPTKLGDGKKIFTLKQNLEISIISIIFLKCIEISSRKIDYCFCDSFCMFSNK